MFLVPVRIVEQTPPLENHFGAFSYTLTIGYIAQTEDTGKKMICKSVQTDTNGKEVTSELASLLTVKAKPPPEALKGLGVGVIAIIVSCAALFLMVLIFLCVAFRTGRYCFKNRRDDVIKAEQVSNRKKYFYLFNTTSYQVRE